MNKIIFIELLVLIAVIVMDYNKSNSQDEHVNIELNSEYSKMHNESFTMYYVQDLNFVAYKDSI